MELKVWVEGIQRIVCGVTDSTTCQDVVFALAHATGKSGRFTLTERWRNNERQLGPNENPLKVLMKWGEYSNDVQFILKCNEVNKHISNSNNTKSRSTPTTPCIHSISSNNSAGSDSPKQDLPKSFTFSIGETLGILKGAPSPNNLRNCTLEVRNNSPHLQSPRKISVCGSDKSESPSQRVPPPYRNPPPPTSSILKSENTQNAIKETSDTSSKHDDSLSTAQYKELVKLINYQKEKLATQQDDLNKYDTELAFWEEKEHDKQIQLESLTKELIAISNMSKLNDEEIQILGHVDAECELVKQQEKTLRCEITLLRSKLANCETELLQYKNKIRLLMDECNQWERHSQQQSKRTVDFRQHTVVSDLNHLMEVDRLQHDLELIKQNTELQQQTTDTLHKEIVSIEAAIMEKKKHVDLLVTEMKAANLESLAIIPPDDVRAILDGSTKLTATTRRMIGSPRQLENAVPTNKNPHGVWV